MKIFALSLTLNNFNVPETNPLLNREYIRKLTCLRPNLHRVGGEYLRLELIEPPRPHRQGSIPLPHLVVEPLVRGVLGLVPRRAHAEPEHLPVGVEETNTINGPFPQATLMIKYKIKKMSKNFNTSKKDKTSYSKHLSVEKEHEIAIKTSSEHDLLCYACL